jgi:hypothetical protein
MEHGFIKLKPGLIGVVLLEEIRDDLSVERVNVGSGIHVHINAVLLLESFYVLHGLLIVFVVLPIVYGLIYFSIRSSLLTPKIERMPVYLKLFFTVVLVLIQGLASQVTKWAHIIRIYGYTVVLSAHAKKGYRLRT